MENIILINTNSRTVKKQRDNLGINGENEQERLVFCLDKKVDGIARLEIKREEEKYFIELQKEEDNYVLVVKSSLLTKACDIEMQLVITQAEQEVFKSRTFTMQVLEAINENTEETAEVE